ncbi:MAG: ATP-dependent sacrificial sulfur transferase LarE [Candidatus Odinarchaeota archaeon]
MSELQEKIAELESFLAGKINLVAFSGGVDSTVIVAVSAKVAKHTIAITCDSPTVPPGEVDEAKDLAASLGVEHVIVKVDELQDPDFKRNPLDRCYFCKRGLTKAIVEFKENWLKKHPQIRPEDVTILEGTNFTELGGHRPGFKAVKEGGAIAPLVVTGFTKKDIRDLARELRLPNADKPSLACLSSRIQHGTPITAEKLVRIGQAEKFIKREFGILIARVRDHDGLARIEIGKDEIGKLLDKDILKTIHDELKRLGFKYVTVDALGYRTGSMSADF